MSESLPEMERRFLFGKCPACGHRFWNGLFQWVAYSMHYATAHLGIQVFRNPRGDQ